MKIWKFIKRLFIKTEVVEETVVTPEEAAQLMREAAEDTMFAMAFPEASYIDMAPVPEARTLNDREAAEFFGMSYAESNHFVDVDDDDLPF